MSKFRRRPKQIPLRVVSSLASIAALLVAFFALPKSVKPAPSRAPAAPTVSSLPSNQTQLRIERLRLHSRHASEPDPGHCRRSGKSANLQPVWNPALCVAVSSPGTYGSSTHPLNFQVGYYTSVAGLGLSPNDVVINGSIYVRNQCLAPRIA